MCIVFFFFFKSLTNWHLIPRRLRLKSQQNEQKPPLKSVTDSKGNYDHFHNETIGPSDDRRSATDFDHCQRRSTKTTDVLALGGWNGSSGRCFDQASR